MNNVNRMPMWRKVLISVCTLVICTLIIVVCFININEDTEKYLLSKASHGIVLKFNELSPEERHRFLLDNEDKLKQFKNNPYTYDAMAEILYNNRQYIAYYGEDAFHYAAAHGIDHDQMIAKLWNDVQRRYEHERDLWEQSLRVVILLTGACLFFLIIRKVGRKNIHARNLALYCIVSFIVDLLLFFSDRDVEFVYILFDFLSVLILSLMEVFLAKKSREDYHRYFLIPVWFSEKFHADSEFRKRLCMIFLFYPFFYVVPIPMIGIFFFAFYILPVSLILSVLWIVMWVREGKKIDSKLQAKINKAQLYCRHCGKLIDADSDYCRHCGRRL